jgi:MOSC domain-containing protein
VSSTGAIGRISLAPVKGLALVHPESVELTEQGAAGDRRLHLIDERDHVVNGKRVGALMRVRANLDPVADTLELRFPDGCALAGPIVLGEPTITSFWGRPVPGHLVEGPWSKALSEFAGKRLRLVRAVDAGAASDRGPTVTMISAASFERLAEKAGLEAPVDGRRFRMLFEVSGLEAHTEDGWVGGRVRVGSATVGVQGHVGRCVVTCRNPDSGGRDLDTLGAIAGYRRDLPTTEKVAFGVWGRVIEPGAVRVGDRVVPDRG